MKRPKLGSIEGVSTKELIANERGKLKKKQDERHDARFWRKKAAEAYERRRTAEAYARAHRAQTQKEG